MFTLLVVIFIIGYAAIALEHSIRVDKAASALLIGSILWALYAINAESLLALGDSPSWDVIGQKLAQLKSAGIDGKDVWKETVANGDPMHFVKHELSHHIVEIAEILFFLFGAMTIVEIIDQHEGFKIITDKIKTTKKIKLLWVLSILAFFMSALLDNLTSIIVMIALLRKIIEDKETRWFFASMLVLAANAGGAWSPIGDVTTIMLWIGGQVTFPNIVVHLIFPSLITMLVPLCIVSFTMKGNVKRPPQDENEVKLTTRSEQVFMLVLGVALLLFVPVFKSVTHLPPFLGMLFGLGVMWLTTEIMHSKKTEEYRSKLIVIQVLKRVETPTIFFFLGILSAVACLQSIGHLALLAEGLEKITNQNVYVINLAIGVLSSIVDNVPLVAGAMGMYKVADPGTVGFAANMVQDGLFWELLAYCAGTGGSILIIGSAAGVAAMGLEKINFVWYLKKISLLALIGYLAGAGAYYLQAQLFFS